MDWLRGNRDHSQPYPILQHNVHLYACVIPLPLREGVTTPSTATVSQMQAKSGHVTKQG